MQGVKEYKGLAIVLSRTNYGEADRIIHFLTPEGVVSAVGRGVRREKSKLRGGSEPFALNEISVRSNSGGLGTLRSARAKHLYENIIYNFDAMEVAADIIKLMQKLTRDHDDPHFFEVLLSVLTELEKTERYQAVILWAYLHIVLSVGTQLNLTHDAGGLALTPETRYVFSAHDHSFVVAPSDTYNVYTARHIKLLRLAVATNLETFLKIRDVDELVPLCMGYARAELQQ